MLLSLTRQVVGKCVSSFGRLGTERRGKVSPCEGNESSKGVCEMPSSRCRSDAK